MTGSDWHFIPLVVVREWIWIRWPKSQEIWGVWGMFNIFSLHWWMKMPVRHLNRDIQKASGNMSLEFRTGTKFENNQHYQCCDVTYRECVNKRTEPQRISMILKEEISTETIEKWWRGRWSFTEAKNRLCFRKSHFAVRPRKMKTGKVHSQRSKFCCRWNQFQTEMG